MLLQFPKGSAGYLLLTGSGKTQNQDIVDDYDYLLAYMGQIKINFKYGGEDLEERNLTGENFGLAQALQRLHRIDFIESLDISQVNGIISIGVDIKGVNRIDWSKTEISDYVPLQMLKDLEYYSEMSHKLDRLLSDLDYANFDWRDKIEDAGREALQLIESFTPSVYFKEWGTKRAINEIKHTMNQEVKMLVQNSSK